MPRVAKTEYEKASDDYEICFRSAMLKRRMKQRDLAKKMGKSQGTISLWLNNLDSVDFGNLRKMARCLGITITITGE